MDSERIALYQCIVSQLEDDGFHGAAAMVAQTTMIPCQRQEKDRLGKLVRIGQRAVQQSGRRVDDLAGGGNDAKALKPSDEGGRQTELDLSTPAGILPAVAYTTKFITTHKAACRVAKFNSDGSLMATGSADASMKVLGVGKMLNFAQTGRSSDEFAAAKPVLRTLYNHTQPVNDLDWHPYRSILMSCGKDSTIKFMDCSKAGTKHPEKSIQDTHNVYSAAFHPSGDYVVAGTEHHMAHIYDVETLQCFTPSVSESHHVGGINQVCCAGDGKQFATAGKDGTVKLWDIVSSTCIATLDSAHDKMEVTSVSFSKNQKYLLSAGRNNAVVLWDLTAKRPLLYFNGHRHARHRSQACFSHNEDFVITSDDASGELVFWNSRTGELAQRIGAGHNASIRWVAHSPVAPHLVTCSEDARCRFWAGTG